MARLCFSDAITADSSTVFCGAWGQTYGTGLIDLLLPLPGGGPWSPTNSIAFIYGRLSHHNSGFGGLLKLITIYK